MVQSGHTARSPWPRVARGCRAGWDQPQAVCSGDSPVAFPWNPSPCSYPFTFTPTLIPCRPEQPRRWPFPCLGQKPCGLSLGWLWPLVPVPILLVLPSLSPQCPGGGGWGKKSEVSPMPRTGREDRGGEMRGILPEAKALPGFRATHSSA